MASPARTIQKVALASTLVDVTIVVKSPLRRLFVIRKSFFSLLSAAAFCVVLLAVVSSSARSQSLAKNSTSNPPANAISNPASPPPSTGGVFPLSQVHRGLMATAWTVFEGTQPEPMQVEILGVLRNARGPGRDLILARLKGAKPEYTGVVAGMSGSPVYVGNRLMGALSYRIGQFSKEPIAGITPIEQMLEVRDLPAPDGGTDKAATSLDAETESAVEAASVSQPQPAQPPQSPAQPLMQAMDTPLLMSGFSDEAIHLWRERMAANGLSSGLGSSLETIAVGGPLGEAASQATNRSPILPGSAVSLQMVRGDLEIAATCTVTYVDARHLLACGHPVLQAGNVSLPMTRAEVVATLPSPLNAFKIINTGATIGAFTQDRDAAIGGLLGAQAAMIPLRMTVTTGEHTVTHHVEILNLPTMTSSALLVSVYQLLLQTNRSTAETSYHVTGTIHLRNAPPVPVDSWGAPGANMVPQLAAAIGVGSLFDALYASSLRNAASQSIESLDLHVDAEAGNRTTTLDAVRVLSSGIVHAGDTVALEAVVHRWQQPEQRLKLTARLPQNLPPGTLRLLVSDGATLDRTLDGTAPRNDPGGFAATLNRLRRRHAQNRLYLSLLLPEAEASFGGQVLDSIPLSMANALEPLHQASAAGLNGESLEIAGSDPVDGVLSGSRTVELHIESGGGLH